MRGGEGGFEPLERDGLDHHGEVQVDEGGRLRLDPIRGQDREEFAQRELNLTFLQLLQHGIARDVELRLREGVCVPRRAAQLGGQVLQKRFAREAQRLQPESWL